MSETAGRSPAITEHSLTVRRTARYATLGPLDGTPAELWIACHGYGQLAARFIRPFAVLDDGTRTIVAPEALSRYYLDSIPERRTQPTPRVGATWMTREDRAAEIDDYCAYLDQLLTHVRATLSAVPARTVVLGFSQGTATVCRWLAASAHRVDDLVLWSGGIPPELDVMEWAKALRGASITLVTGDTDTMVPAEAILAEEARLTSAGVSYRREQHAGGHQIDGETLQRVACALSGIQTSAG